MSERTPHHHVEEGTERYPGFGDLETELLEDTISALPDIRVHPDQAQTTEAVIDQTDNEQLFQHE